MAATKMVETRNFGTYNKKDSKTISGHVPGKVASMEPKEKTTSTKNLRNKLEKSTESIKRTKLEDLKQEANVAQRSREEREDERRKRIDELRTRNNDRRSRVEERKRLIFEAEREKQEAILRKNQEIEARIEARRNKEKEEKKKKKIEKSNTPVAFGSSTPRMLCVNDVNGSFCSSCWTIAKERDSSKRQTSIIAGGHVRKFNESCNANKRSERSSLLNLQTTNKRNEQVRRTQTPRNVTVPSESIYTSSIKVFRRLPCSSYGEVTPTSRSRSNSSMSQKSTSTSSMDSCNVKLRPRTIINRQRGPIIDNTTSVPVKVANFSRDTKSTPIKSPLPKVCSTPKVSSTTKPSGIKKRVTAETTTKVEKNEDEDLMNKTMRLANEMLEIERQKLQMAIEETKRWEEEERRKQEEKDRKKKEKEEAEKKAMEEAERLRVEFFERLKKSEEERLARRKRVEIIMLRTRA